MIIFNFVMGPSSKYTMTQRYVLQNTAIITARCTLMVIGKECEHFETTYSWDGGAFPRPVCPHGEWWNFHKYEVYIRRFSILQYGSILWMYFGIGRKALETEIAKYILSLGRVPIAWEEALLKTNLVSFIMWWCRKVARANNFVKI